jgi:hypothetical protein
VNGTEPQIGVLKPFGEAFNRMKLILFQPFDLGKWCVIGFAAWLAHIGGGFNYNFNYNQRSRLNQSPAWRDLTEAIHSIPFWVLIGGVSFLVIFFLGLTILFAWLRAQGRFLFTDCIVKNRAAIAEPWREFQKQGNSYFLLSLLVGLGFLIWAALLFLPLLLPVIRGGRLHHLHEPQIIIMLVIWGLAIFLFALAWALIANLMIPIMYRRRCLAGQGFRAALSLIAEYPGEIVLYCLFWIVLGIGSVVVACAAICLTCCIAALPYVGTVILLPLYVCLRGFGLFFLRQFGPDYDVWATIPAPPLEQPPPPPPLPV